MTSSPKYYSAIHSSQNKKGEQIQSQLLVVTGQHCNITSGGKNELLLFLCRKMNAVLTFPSCRVEQGHPFAPPQHADFAGGQKQWGTGCRWHFGQPNNYAHCIASESLVSHRSTSQPWQRAPRVLVHQLWHEVKCGAESPLSCRNYNTTAHTLVLTPHSSGKCWGFMALPEDLLLL